MITTQIHIESLTVSELKVIIAEVVREVINEEKNSFKPEQKKERELMKRAQTAEFIGISVKLLIKWTNLGIIEARDIGGQPYYSRSAIEACLIAPYYIPPEARNHFEKIRAGRPPKHQSFLR